MRPICIAANVRFVDFHRLKFHPQSISDFHQRSFVPSEIRGCWLLQKNFKITVFFVFFFCTINWNWNCRKEKITRHLNGLDWYEDLNSRTFETLKTRNQKNLIIIRSITKSEIVRNVADKLNNSFSSTCLDFKKRLLIIMFVSVGSYYMLKFWSSWPSQSSSGRFFSVIYTPDRPQMNEIDLRFDTIFKSFQNRDNLEEATGNWNMFRKWEKRWK